MVMKLTPNLEETTVQGIDMKCFLIGSSVTQQTTEYRYCTGVCRLLPTVPTADLSARCGY